MPQLRLPATSNTASAFWWALGFAVYIWLGGVAVGVASGTAFVVALVAGFGIFVYVRLYGEDERRP